MNTSEPEIPSSNSKISYLHEHQIQDKIQTRESLGAQENSILAMYYLRESESGCLTNEEGQLVIGYSAMDSTNKKNTTIALKY